MFIFLKITTMANNIKNIIFIRKDHRGNNADFDIHRDFFYLTKMSLRNIINNLTLEYIKESVLRVAFLSQA